MDGQRRENRPGAGETEPTISFLLHERDFLFDQGVTIAEIILRHDHPWKLLAEGFPAIV